MTRGRGATTGWAWQWSEALYAAGSSQLLDLRAVAASERNHPGGVEGDEVKARSRGEGERRGRRAPAGGLPLFRAGRDTWRL